VKTKLLTQLAENLKHLPVKLLVLHGSLTIAEENKNPPVSRI
jgi:hypothetical protein